MLNKYNEVLTVKNIDLILRYEYKYNIGSLSLFVINANNAIFDFEFLYDHNFETDTILIDDNADDINFFLNFLNQERNLQNRRTLFEFNDVKEFSDGVWNRTIVQFHASFSFTSRQYIGLNNDFWQSPTKLFHFYNSSTFAVRFSFDGIHYFIPRYVQFIIELSYIFNYKRVKVNL